MADGGQISVEPILRIRVATTDDVDDLMKIATLATAENGFVEPNPMKLLQTIYGAATLQTGVIGIIGPEGSLDIEGVVLLCIGSQWYSDSLGIEERVVWVRPDLRSARGGRGKLLCEYSKSVADGLGLPLVIGVLSNRRTAAKVRMYQRIFGEPAGAFFLYGAETGAAA